MLFRSHRGGGGLGGRSSRRGGGGGRGGFAEDAGELVGGGIGQLPGLGMDNNYRTHMLFPGRKDEDGGGGRPSSSRSDSSSIVLSTLTLFCLCRFMSFS